MRIIKTLVLFAGLNVFFKPTLISAFDLNLALSECENDPCHCDEADLNCIDSTCHDDSGCNQCQSGYFKVDYQYKCVSCEEVFGDGCQFCQDFNGCGQCNSGYTRVQGTVSGLWHCIETDGNDFTRVPINTVSAFGGFRTEEEFFRRPFSNPPIPMSGIPTAGEIDTKTPLFDVDPAGNQYRTYFSASYIQSLLDLYYTSGYNDCTDNNNCAYDENNEDTSLTDCIDTCINTYGRRRLATTFPDTRWEVSGTPSWRPAIHTGSIKINGADWCSGVLVGPKHVLTAGHCLYDAKNDWYGGWEFYPRQTKDYASYAIGWSRAMVWEAWAFDEDWDFDIGIIELNVALDNTGLGWTRFGFDGSLGANNNFMHHKGYPGDKNAGTQWSSSAFMSDAFTFRFESVTSDVPGGSSGGPWYKYINDGGAGPVVYAVQSHDCCWDDTFTNLFFSYNGHARITSLTFYQLLDFIDDCDVDPRC